MGAGSPSRKRRMLRKKSPNVKQNFWPEREPPRGSFTRFTCRVPRPRHLRGPPRCCPCHPHLRQRRGWLRDAPPLAAACAGDARPRPPPSTDSLDSSASACLPIPSEAGESSVHPGAQPCIPLTEPGHFAAWDSWERDGKRAPPGCTGDGKGHSGAHLRREGRGQSRALSAPRWRPLQVAAPTHRRAARHVQGIAREETHLRSPPDGPHCSLQAS